MEDKKVWDGQAQEYQRVFRQGQNEYNEGVLRFLKAQGLLQPGDTVLDVGCGVGKYGVMLAQRGHAVTLTDISPEMLHFAGQNLQAVGAEFQTLCCDFRTVSLENPVFAGGFDLCMSTMCPAVCDADTAKKLTALSRRGCFLADFYAWEQPLRSAVFEKAGLPEQRMFRDPKADCERLLAEFRRAGYEVKTQLVDYCWGDARTPEAMADYLLGHYHLPGSLRSRLLLAAGSLSNGEPLWDEIRTKVAWIWWFR